MFGGLPNNRQQHCGNYTNIKSSQFFKMSQEYY